MKLILESRYFEHVPDRSWYNNNVYKHIGESHLPTEILEICHEDYDYYTYYLSSKNERQGEFLGSSSASLSNNGEVEIDFRFYYT